MASETPRNDDGRISDVAEGAAPAAPSFVFSHKVFAAPHAQFRIDATTGEPALFLDLGDIKVGLNFETLKRHFAIADDSNDGRMLKAVLPALKFVSAIRPGDPFPAELIDGSASLPVGAANIYGAKRRVLRMLVKRRVAGAAGPNPPNLGALQSVAEIEAALEAELKAYVEDARRKGVDPAHIEQMALRILDEMAYLELLAERINRKKRILIDVRNALPRVSKDKSVVESVKRVLQLLRPPVSAYQRSLDELDRRLETEFRTYSLDGELIETIRETRDHLHTESIHWDSILSEWEAADAAASGGIEQRIASTYRFAARFFPATREWSPA